MAENVQQNWIASFWRRIGAFLIDSLILGTLGFLLALVFESTFVLIGEWGKLIGFIIALTYFGLMNSKLFNGQTIGKKLLNIRVVDLNNQTISMVKSFFRYFVLATPFSLNGIILSSEVLFSYLMYLFSAIVFGGVFSIAYLYIFNRVTRQSLHDLVVGTLVVNTNIEKQEIGKIWKFHLVIVMIVFVIVTIIPTFTGKLLQNKPFKNIHVIQSALSNEKDVVYARVSAGITTFSSTNNVTRTTKYMTAQVILSSNKIDNTELAKKFADIVFQNYPDIINKDVFRIVLTYGYDIGIWSQWSSYTHVFKPSEFTNIE